MSVLNNLTKRYLEEEKVKAKDKFTFIFQTEKDEDLDIKQLQTAKVYHVIDEPQFNENDNSFSRGHFRLTTGLESTILGIKRFSKGGSLHERQFQKQQQQSEQQIHRQVQFEKKGQLIRENMTQKKREKIISMKKISENKLQEQERIAQNVIDIHTKGHLVYVDYGEEQNTRIKELKQSPKNTELEQINYSKIIQKTQEFLDQEERYDQIKKDLKFKFNFITDKSQALIDNQESINENQNNIKNKSNNISPVAGKNNPNISLFEGDINITSLIGKDHNKKVDQELLKYLKSESSDYLIDKDHVGGDDNKSKRGQQNKLHPKPPIKQHKNQLQNSHSAKQDVRDKSIISMIDNRLNVRQGESSPLKESQLIPNQVKQFEVCKTECDERQQVKLPLRTARSQLANVLSRKEGSQKSINERKQNQESISAMNGLVSQKTRIQKKIAQQRMKFDELLNQISFVTNNPNRGDLNVSASLDLQEYKKKKQKEQADIQLINDRNKLNENQLSVQLEYTQNKSANNAMHGVKLPQINNKHNSHNDNEKDNNSYMKYLNQENIQIKKVAQGQINKSNRYYSTGNSAQKNYSSSNTENDKSNYQNQHYNVYTKGIDKSNQISDSSTQNTYKNTSRISHTQNHSATNVQVHKLKEPSKILKDQSRILKDQSSLFKDSSFLDQSISTVVDIGMIRNNDKIKTEESVQRKVRSFKSLHAHNNSNNIKGEVKQKQISQQSNKHQIEPSLILQTISPSAMFNADQSNITFLHNQESILNLQDNSCILKQLQEQSHEQQHHSQSKLNENTKDKKRYRSKTFHDAEILLTRIKKRSDHYHEHQEQIKNQIQNFNFDKIKQRQINILQTFKDQKVPDMVKKRLHHDFIDILSMCQN